jgi:hypothetical protein
MRKDWAGMRTDLITLVTYRTARWRLAGWLGGAYLLRLDVTTPR